MREKCKRFLRDCPGKNPAYVNSGRKGGNGINHEDGRGGGEITLRPRRRSLLSLAKTTERDSEASYGTVTYGVEQVVEKGKSKGVFEGRKKKLEGGLNSSAFPGGISKRCQEKKDSFQFLRKVCIVSKEGRKRRVLENF